MKKFVIFLYFQSILVYSMVSDQKNLDPNPEGPKL